MLALALAALGLPGKLRGPCQAPGGLAGGGRAGSHGRVNGSTGASHGEAAAAAPWPFAPRGVLRHKVVAAPRPKVWQMVRPALDKQVPIPLAETGHHQGTLGVQKVVELLEVHDHHFCSCSLMVSLPRKQQSSKSSNCHNWWVTVRD